MSTQLLEQIGLNEEQAKVYLSLISSGTLPARKIALQSGVNRSLVYKILKQLIELGLVIENLVPSSVSTFTALHPSHLHSFIKKKEEDLKLADNALHETISILGAQFNLTNKKPSVRFYEGIKGIEMLYKDIIHTGKDIKLIRSPFDKNTPEIEALLRKQINDQVEKNINVKMIGPVLDVPSYEELLERDKKRLVTRCQIPKEKINIPAQITIYGEKVSMTSYKDHMITTIVEDKGVSETFNILFDLIWEKYF